MPIRFRCFYCNQLMGISRRKAGTMVRCPTCASQVMVPQPSTESVKKESIGAKPSIFDGNDFEKVFAAASPPSPAPAPQAPQLQEPITAPPPPLEEFDAPVAIATPGARAGGFFISSTLATMICVGALIALAVAFVCGLLVGKILLAAK